MSTDDTVKANIDFEALTDEQRLGLIECVLGLLPSGPDFVSRAVFVAFQIAGQSRQDQIEHSLRLLERAEAPDVDPRFFDRVLDFARDMHGLRVERQELPNA